MSLANSVHNIRAAANIILEYSKRDTYQIDFESIDMAYFVLAETDPDEPDREWLLGLGFTPKKGNESYILQLTVGRRTVEAVCVDQSADTWAIWPLNLDLYELQRGDVVHLLRRLREQQAGKGEVRE